MDEYQKRYLEHIENKLNRKYIKTTYTEEEKLNMLKIMQNRKSVRKFNKNNVKNDILGLLDFAVSTSPSSCNRKGIYYEEVDVSYANILVGGKNWLKTANRLFFLYGAKKCYKNPKEISYMPFLDGGFVAQNIYLLCEVYGYGCCFINPNKTEELENEDYFIGAIGIGDYDV